MSVKRLSNKHAMAKIVKWLTFKVTSLPFKNFTWKIGEKFCRQMKKGTGHFLPGHCLSLRTFPLALESNAMCNSKYGQNN